MAPSLLHLPSLIQELIIEQLPSQTRANCCLSCWCLCQISDSLVRTVSVAEGDLDQLVHALRRGRFCNVRSLYILLDKSEVQDSYTKLKTQAMLLRGLEELRWVGPGCVEQEALRDVLRSAKNLKTLHLPQLVGSKGALNGSIAVVTKAGGTAQRAPSAPLLVSALPLLTQLRRLSLSPWSTSDSVLVQLASLTQLIALDIGEEQEWEYQHVGMLTSALTGMTSLRMAGIHDANSCCKHLCKATALRALTVNGATNLSEAGLHHITVLGSLTELHLNALRQPELLHLGALRLLTSLTHLKYLSLGVVLGNDELSALNGCPLMELEVEGLALEGDGCMVTFSHLQRLQCHRVFHLSHHLLKELFPILEAMHIASPNQEDLRQLKRHPNLRCLKITHNDLSALDLSPLISLTHLSELELASKDAFKGWNWTPSVSLSHVSKVTLTHIATDATLNLLVKHFSTLASVQLNMCYYVTDWGLKKLCRMAELVEVSLRVCPHITDYGLVSIATRNNIKRIAVVGCQQITDDVCSRVRKVAHREDLDIVAR